MCFLFYRSVLSIWIASCEDRSLSCDRELNDNGMITVQRGQARLEVHVFGVQDRARGQSDPTDFCSNGTIFNSLFSSMHSVNLEVKIWARSRWTTPLPAWTPKSFEPARESLPVSTPKSIPLSSCGPYLRFLARGYHIVLPFSGCRVFWSRRARGIWIMSDLTKLSFILN